MVWKVKIVLSFLLGLMFMMLAVSFFCRFFVGLRYMVFFLFWFIFYGVIFRIKSLKIPPASVLLLEAAGVCACIISITNWLIFFSLLPFVLFFSSFRRIRDLQSSLNSLLILLSMAFMSLWMWVHPCSKMFKIYQFYAIATEKLLDLNCTAHWTSIENHTGTSANMGIKVDLHVLGPKMRAVLVHLVLFFLLYFFLESSV